MKEHFALNRLFSLFVVLASLSVSTASYAGVISFSPVSQTANPGDSFDISLIYSGQGEGILSPWNIDVIYDDTILSATAVSFSNFLFMPEANFTSGQISLSGGNAEDVLQDSLIGPQQTLNLCYSITPPPFHQDCRDAYDAAITPANALYSDYLTALNSSFVFATLSFTALGTSPLTLDTAVVSFQTLPETTGVVCVGADINAFCSSSSSVPEPSTFILLGLAITGLGFRRGRRSRKSLVRDI